MTAFSSLRPSPHETLLANFDLDASLANMNGYRFPTSMPDDIGPTQYIYYNANKQI